MEPCTPQIVLGFGLKLTSFPLAPGITEKPMPRLDFELIGDYVELNMLLKLTGLCDSGGAGKRLVADGAVKVDGVNELRKTCKVRAGQVVALGDTSIHVTPGPGNSVDHR